MLAASRAVTGRACNSRYCRQHQDDVIAAIDYWAFRGTSFPTDQGPAYAFAAFHYFARAKSARSHADLAIAAPRFFIRRRRPRRRDISCRLPRRGHMA